MATPTWVRKLPRRMAGTVRGSVRSNQAMRGRPPSNRISLSTMAAIRARLSTMLRASRLAKSEGRRDSRASSATKPALTSQSTAMASAPCVMLWAKKPGVCSIAGS